MSNNSIPQCYQNDWWKLVDVLLLDDNGPEHILTLIADIERIHSVHGEYADVDNSSYNALPGAIRQRYQQLMHSYIVHKRSYRANSIKTIDALNTLHPKLVRIRENRLKFQDQIEKPNEKTKTV